MEALAAPEAVPKQRVRTVTCRFHCGGCERHFSSEEAFELHRAGSFQKGTRHCRAPETVGKLVAKSEDGRCDIGYSHAVAGITVWQTLAASQAGGWE